MKERQVFGRGVAGLFVLLLTESLFIWLALAGFAAAGVTQEWVRRYNGPGNIVDVAYAIAVDGQGNVYVTGSSLVSGTNTDYATIKYGPDGSQKWVRRYNGPGNGFDWAYALAVDGQGNVYVTGYSQGSGTSADYATIKYDGKGNEKWVRRYNGPGNDFDWAYAIAVDGQSNVYVTGISSGGLTLEDYVTIKYDANGNEKWVSRYNKGSDRAYAIAVDSQGNVYVTGSSLVYATYTDYATIKYDANGNEKWVRRYNGPANSSDGGSAIAVDSQGNVYVTGYSIGANYYADYATIKYDANGNEKWVRRYNGPGNRDDGAYAVAVDSQGNVYVTGVSGIPGQEDYATIKYDTHGNEKWVRFYNGPGNGNDWARALAVDGQGNVYVTGDSEGSGTGSDYATIKYDANGTEKWVQRYNGPGNGGDDAKAIVVDGQGNVYVTGYSTGSGTSLDYATIKYREAEAGGAVDLLLLD